MVMLASQAHTGKTHMQKVINSSQVPQEHMDWGHRPWKDKERVRQLVTSDG